MSIDRYRHYPRKLGRIINLIDDRKFKKAVEAFDITDFDSDHDYMSFIYQYVISHDENIQNVYKYIIKMHKDHFVHYIEMMQKALQNIHDYTSSQKCSNIMNCYHSKNKKTLWNIIIQALKR